MSTSSNMDNVVIISDDEEQPSSLIDHQASKNNFTLTPRKMAAKKNNLESKINEILKNTALLKEQQHKRILPKKDLLPKIGNIYSIPNSINQQIIHKKTNGNEKAKPVEKSKISDVIEIPDEEPDDAAPKSNDNSLSSKVHSENDLAYTNGSDAPLKNVLKVSEEDSTTVSSTSKPLKNDLKVCEVASTTEASTTSSMDSKPCNKNEIELKKDYKEVTEKHKIHINVLWAKVCIQYDIIC